MVDVILSQFGVHYRLSYNATSEKLQLAIDGATATDIVTARNLGGYRLNEEPDGALVVTYVEAGSIKQLRSTTNGATWA